MARWVVLVVLLLFSCILRASSTDIFGEDVQESAAEDSVYYSDDSEYFLDDPFTFTYNETNACIAACDQLAIQNTVVCTIDRDLNYITRLTSKTAVSGTPSCYTKCGLAIRYPGTCECPNFCYNSTKQGACVEGSGCVCSEGWSGADCSNIKCPENSCSGHGKCVSESLDYCVCDHGWTSYDCSTPVNDMPILPYGELYNVPYWTHDIYTDKHPLFNVSVMATINVNISNADYNFVLLPWNLYNQSYVSGNMTFDNGNHHLHFDNVGLKIKGAYARMRPKKSWAISLSTFKKGRRIFDVKKFGLKAPTTGQQYIANQATVELLRAAAVPSYRGSYANLWINGVYWGLYWIHEDVDDIFANGRFQAGTGNMYSCASQAYLDYKGDDENIYKSLNKTNPMGVPNFSYDQSEGDGDWSDLVELIKVFNVSQQEEFSVLLPKTWDVNSFLRWLVVISFVNGQDNYMFNGNNWGMYHDPKTNQWIFIPRDFDSSFTFTSAKTIFQYVSNPPSVIAKRIFENPQRNATFISLYQTFLTKTVNNTDVYSTSGRILSLMDFLIPSFSKDRFYNLHGKGTIKGLRTAIQNIVTFINNRYPVVWEEIFQSLPTYLKG